MERTILCQGSPHIGLSDTITHMRWFSDKRANVPHEKIPKYGSGRVRPFLASDSWFCKRCIFPQAENLVSRAWCPLVDVSCCGQLLQREPSPVPCRLFNHPSRVCRAPWAEQNIQGLSRGWVTLHLLDHFQYFRTLPLRIIYQCRTDFERNLKGTGHNRPRRNLRKRKKDSERKKERERGGVKCFFLVSFGRANMPEVGIEPNTTKTNQQQLSQEAHGRAREEVSGLPHGAGGDQEALGRQARRGKETPRGTGQGPTGMYVCIYLLIPYPRTHVPPHCIA